ncbi:MAG: PKD domain-containing protein, partial [Methanotrichaceae archaeon]|nr:PKD domain-containing protein [Methanotrichaceae archaeon]
SKSKRITIPPSTVTYLKVDPIKYSDFYVEGVENYRFGLTVYYGDEKVVDTGFDFAVESGAFKIIRPISEVEKGIINYEYSFSVRSIGVPESARYEWDFGDGKQASGKTVTHSFAEPRKYNVKVRAAWDGGSKEDETVFEIAPDQVQVEKEEVTFYVFRTVKPLGKDPTTGQPWKGEKQACNNFTLTLMKDGALVDMGVDGGVARATNGVLTVYLIPGDYAYKIEYSYPRPPETGTKTGSFKVVAGGRNMIDVETSQVSPDFGASDGGRSVDSGQSVDSGTSVDSGRSLG